MISMDLVKLTINLCILVLGWKSYNVGASFNLARGKPVLQDSTADNGPAENAVDGSYDQWHSNYNSCTHSANPRKVHYWMVDLKAKFRIGKVRIWNRKDRCCYERLRGLTLYISRNITKNGRLKLYGVKKCGVYDGPPDQEVDFIEMSCGGKKGRYVSIVKKGGFLSLCEVEVFEGPTEENLETPTEINLPNLRQELTQGLHKVEFPYIVYSPTVIPISEQSEAIIVNPKNGRPILVASTLGKGRIIATGIEGFCDQYDLLYEPFLMNIMKWLSYGADPSFTRPAYQIERKDFDKPGKIIFWCGHYKLKKEMLKMIRDLLISGKTSIIYGLYHWKDFETANQDLILEAGIYVNPSVAIKDGAKHWDISYSRPEDHVSLVNRLRQAHTLPDNTFTQSVMRILDLLSLLPTKAVNFIDKYVIRKVVSKLISINVKKLYISKFKPTRTEYQNKLCKIFSQLMLSPMLIDSGIKAPNVHVFPGSVPHSAPRVVMDLEFKASAAHEMHPTGLYLPPGETLSVEVLSESPEISQWTVRIGCHTDDLEGKEELFRFPKITNKMKLCEKKIYNGFGGVVIVTNLKADISITLRFKGAVKSPFFNLRDERNMAAWDTERRFAPGPWTEIAGDAMVYCVPTKSVKHYSSAHLKNVMRNYVDKFVKGDHHLRGSDWKTSRRERFSLDIQIELGSGHAGYPLMARLNWLRALMEIRRLSCVSKKECSWGLIHEIGHNFQKMSWTFQGTMEVTNNLFALFNLHQLGRHFFERFDKFVNWVDGKHYSKYLQWPNFEDWKTSPWIALTIYAQFAHHFGWGFYKQVFRRYLEWDETGWDFTDAEKDLEKIDKWIVTTSQVRGYNLIPTFDFWGFPISDNVKSQLKGLTNYYLPDDFVTQHARDQVNYIMGKYKSIVRSVPKMDDPYLDEMKRFYEIRENDVIEL